MSYPIRTFEYCEVINVVDGDTLDAVVDAGFSIKTTHRFRLARINTPEKGQPGFKEATDFLRERVLNKPCTLVSQKIDKYGRFLADIIVDGVNINDALLAAKLAVPYV